MNKNDKYVDEILQAKKLQELMENDKPKYPVGQFYFNTDYYQPTTFTTTEFKFKPHFTVTEDNIYQHIGNLGQIGYFGGIEVYLDEPKKNAKHKCRKPKTNETN